MTTIQLSSVFRRHIVVAFLLLASIIAAPAFQFVLLSPPSSRTEPDDDVVDVDDVDDVTSFSALDVVEINVLLSPPDLISSVI